MPLTAYNRLLPALGQSYRHPVAFIISMDGVSDAADRETLADCASSLGGQGGIEQQRLDKQVREEMSKQGREQLRRMKH